MDRDEEDEAPDVVRWREREAAAIEPFADWTADLQPTPEAMQPSVAWLVSTSRAFAAATTPESCSAPS